MKRLAPAAAGAALLASALLPGAEARAPAGGLTSALRYVGRDPATGMPEPIAERGIFEIQDGYERYNEQTRDPVPPPPAQGLDIAGLRAPDIGVDAPVARYGLDRAGRLDVPQDATTVGWQPAYSALPGAGGATFLAAHFAYAGLPGVFWGLSALTPGARIVVVMNDGAEAHYRVTSVEDYLLEAIDMGAILQGREGRESLTLMTCSGPADGETYAYRTVVLAERIDGDGV